MKPVMGRLSDCWKMEGTSRGILALRASPFIFLLLLSLLYIDELGSFVFPSNQSKKERSNLGGSRHIEDQENQHIHLETLVEGTYVGGNQTDQQEALATGFACHSDLHTDVCVSNGPVRIDTLTMKVYATFNQLPQADRTILPYPKKEADWLSGYVSPVQLLQGNITHPPPCRYNHNVPAVVFSTGGNTENIFHDFNELIIPLFLTSRLFQSRFHFIVTDFKPTFFYKYEKIFSHLSSYEVINPAANVGIHCFPGVVVGLHYHDYLAINTTAVPRGNSMLDFKQFLRESYNLKIRDLSQTEKPVLVLISRPNSRMFLNEDEMVTMMKTLGFRVVVAKPYMMANIGKFAKILNSCSVLVAAHGAGLTNIVFLPEGAVMVQVVGLDLEWASAHYYGNPATEMGLHYLEYKIEPEESSLTSRYGRDSPIVTDPASVGASQGMLAGRAVYLGEQNFNINVTRFRNTLVKAVEHIGHSAPLG